MIFITGANGLLGSYVVRSFLSNGLDNIIALKRNDSDLRFVKDFEDKIKWADGDVLDLLTLQEQTKGAKAIIHCAGKVSFDKKDKEELYQVNVEGTRNVVNACIKNNIPKLIFVSSISTFGSSKKTSLISEKSKKNIENLKSNYAVTKLLAEMEIWRGSIEGIGTVIVNPSVILGPGNWQNSSMRIFDYIRKENLFTVDGFMNCVDARDVAEIIFKLYDKNVNGEQFILNAERISYKDLFVKIAKQFNKKPPKLKVPKVALELMYGLDQIRSLLSGKRALITKEIKNSAKGSQYFTSSKIIEELNFKFRSIDETIQWTCKELTTMNV